ncbi:MAG: TonB-dependent receptor [Caulobacteraceae bacterium]
MQGKLVSARISKSLLLGSTALLSMTLAVASGGAARAQDAAAAGESAVTEVVVTGSRIVRRDFTAVSPIVTVNSQAFENRGAVSLEETFNQLPQFQAGANNLVTQASATQPGPTASPGASSVNLRGLGSNRNLVLLDGRRAQPANAALFVDLNSLPSAAIEGVEVITGGASATYGADAISGVVNFKLKRNFQGMEVDAQYGISQHGDGNEPAISALIGGNFADNKGNAMFGVSWTQRSEIKRYDRDFFLNGLNDPTTNPGNTYPSLTYAGFDWGSNATFVGLSGANAPSRAVLDSIFGAGVLPANATSVAVNPNGTVFFPTLGANGVSAPRYSGTLGQLGTVSYKINNAGALGWDDLEGSLTTPLTRYSMFSNAHYDINPHITAFIQGNFSETVTTTNLASPPAVQFWGAAIPHDAAHPTTPELERLLNSRPDPTAPWSSQISGTTLFGRRNLEETNNTYQMLAGLRGDIPSTDWTWELYGSHGRTGQTVNFDHGYAQTKKYQAFMALPNYGANGTISLGSNQTAHCTSGFGNALFNNGPVSADCLKAIGANLMTQSELSQNIVEGTIQGGLFNLPAGQLRFAVGLDYRENRYTFNVDPASDANAIIDPVLGQFPNANTFGFINVKEAYGELLVPVLKDLPLIKRFNLELGLRYSDYSTAGGSFTYKAMGDFAVNDYVTFRGGYQLANRAPNIAELYQASSTTVVGIAAGDPCANNTVVPWGNNAGNPRLAETRALCAALIKKFDPNFVYNPATYTGLFPTFFPITIDLREGNPDLKPEKAKTFTAGAVLRSPFQSPLLQNFTISGDWYNIKINDAINPLTSQTLYEGCFNANGSSNPTLSLTGSDFCKYINREVGTGGNRNARAPFFNFGSIQTSGVDLQVDWRIPAPGMFSSSGSFSLNYVLSYLINYKIQNTPTATPLDYAGTVNSAAGGNQFRYRSFLTATYTTGPASLGFRWRYLPSARDGSLVTSATSTIVGVNSHHEVDLFARWNINRTLTLRAGIENLFDAWPEVAGRNISTNRNSANSSNSTTLPDYDQIGRRFSIGLKARF